MKIYKIARKAGDDFMVKMSSLWSSEWKFEEVYQDILRGNLSFARGQAPVVTKTLEYKNTYFIMDGHHRIMEDMINGISAVWIHWTEHMPYIDAGIGNTLPDDSVKLVDFLDKKEDIKSLKDKISDENI